MFLKRRCLGAGILIGLGALANIMVGGGWLGSLLFATGLFSICVNQYLLLTGQFARLYRKNEDFIYNLIELILMANLNFLGIVIVVLLTSFMTHSATNDVAINIVTARNARLWYQHIAAGAICGSCIQIAVQNYKKDKSAIGVILPVMVFILTGSEHCIADFFYYMLAHNMGMQQILQIFEVMCGNFIGASLVLFCSSGNVIPYLSPVDIQLPSDNDKSNNVSQLNEDSSPGHS